MAQTELLLSMKVTLLVDVLQVKPVIAKLDLSGNSVAEEVGHDTGHFFDSI